MSSEQIFAELEKQVSELQARSDTILDPIRSANAKLKYRVDFLSRAVQEARERSSLDPTSSPSVQMSFLNCASDPKNTSMINVNDLLIEIFGAAIHSAFPQLSRDGIELNVQPSKKESSYQFNSAMKISGSLRKLGLTFTPQQVAETILQHVLPNDVINSLTYMPPGFLVAKITASFATNIIKKSLIHGVQSQAKQKERVVIDYSSPNIAKEMHVGHLRSTIIGDALANILDFLGHSVLRVNHVGDWGTQFGMLLAHLTDKFPTFKTAAPPIGDLQSFYREAKKRFDDDEPFRAKAYSAVVKLQSGDADLIEAWKLICHISRTEFQEIYEILGVKGLVERGESFYHELMGKVVQDLTDRHLLVEEEGRKLFYPPEIPGEKTTIPLTVVKSDGGFTYDTSDLACIKYRVEQDKGTRLIYVTDAGQALHFKVIFACARNAGYVPEAVKTDHVGFGVVLSEEKKKFKTRSGETVRLKDLLAEGRERARLKLIEKGREAVLTPEELAKAESAVSIGCIKYADLRCDKRNDYVFSFDRMLEDRGNTAVYLLYQLTRIKSIKRNAVIDTPTSQLAQLHDIPLTHEREYALAIQLIKFPEIMTLVSDGLAPHWLCTYLFELSGVFSEFYEQCYVIEKKTDASGTQETKINYDRILLCEATAAILEKGLTLLGITSVEKM